MTHHSILREINQKEFILSKTANNTIKNNNNNNNENKIENKIEKSSENKNEKSRGFDGENAGFGQGHIIYNFDKKQFLRKLNGFTKFLIAIGTINSPNEKNIFSNSGNFGSSVLHYVHIPTIVRTAIDQKDNKNDYNNNRGQYLKNKNKKDYFFLDLNNLVRGDTFLVQNSMILEHEIEVMYPIKKEINELFIGGKINNEFNNQNFNLFSNSPNYLGEININIYNRDNRTQITNLNSINKKTHKNTIEINAEISSVSPASTGFSNSPGIGSAGFSDSSSSSVCVRFGGHVGGLWPSPQVNSRIL